jgi:hypothetical protein
VVLKETPALLIISCHRVMNFLGRQMSAACILGRHVQSVDLGRQSTDNRAVQFCTTARKTLGLRLVSSMVDTRLPVQRTRTNDRPLRPPPNTGTIIAMLLILSNTEKAENGILRSPIAVSDSAFCIGDSKTRPRSERFETVSLLF